MDKSAGVKTCDELLADILARGVTIRVGRELQVNPAAEELDRLVSEYGLVLAPVAIHTIDMTSNLSGQFGDK
jgi:hypothetical protein